MEMSYSMDMQQLAAFMGAYSVFFIIIAIVAIVANWKIFTKAGEAGWKCLIPIYNIVVIFKIAGLNPWLILLYFASIIPVIGWIASCVISIVLCIKLAKAFGQSTAFGIGLIFLPFIFTLILAFGSAEYVGPQTEN